MAVLQKSVVNLCQYVIMTRLSQFLYSLCRNVGQKTPSYLYRDQVERINHINVVCTETIDGREQGRRSGVKSVRGGPLEGNVVKLTQAARHCWGPGGAVSPPAGSEHVNNQKRQ